MSPRFVFALVAVAVIFICEQNDTVTPIIEDVGIASVHEGVFPFIVNGHEGLAVSLGDGLLVTSARIATAPLGTLNVNGGNEQVSVSRHGEVAYLTSRDNSLFRNVYRPPHVGEIVEQDSLQEGSPVWGDDGSLVGIVVDGKPIELSPPVPWSLKAKPIAQAVTTGLYCVGSQCYRR